jgi:hypothetical protein
MARVPISKQTTLEEAVAMCVEDGLSDPVEIVTRLSAEMGQPWLLRQLVNVVALLAQKNHGGQTRRDVQVVSATPQRDPGVPRVHLQSACAGAATGLSSCVPSAASSSTERPRARIFRRPPAPRHPLLSRRRV